MCLLRYFDMRLSSSLLWKLLLLCLRLLLAPLLEEKMVSLSLFSLSSLSLLSLFSLFISLLSSLSVEVSRDELLYLQVVNACYLRRKIEKKLKEKGRREDHSSRTSLRRRIIIIVIDSTRRLILRGSSYPSIPCERNVGCLNDISDRIDGVIYRITPSIYREGKGSLLSELSKVEVCLLEVLGIIINHD